MGGYQGVVMIDNFINIYNPQTQREILQQAGILKTPITLWQSLETKKKVMKIGQMKIDTYLKQIEFIPKKEKYFFNSILPIYFYTKHRCTIFKATISFNSQFKLIARWPEAFMIENEREDDRFQPQKKEVTFALRVNDLYYKEFTKLMIDVSQGGMSIRVPANEIHFYDEKANIKAMINGKEKIGVIQNITPMELRGQRGFFRIGVKFF